VTKVRKSVNICQSYHKNKRVSFFMVHSVYDLECVTRPTVTYAIALLPRDALQSAVMLWKVVRPSFRLSVCLSGCLCVCDVGVPWSYSLNFWNNNAKISLKSSLPGGKEAPICSKGIIPKFPVNYYRSSSPFSYIKYDIFHTAKIQKYKYRWTRDGIWNNSTRMWKLIGCGACNV